MGEEDMVGIRADHEPKMLMFDTPPSLGCLPDV